MMKRYGLPIADDEMVVAHNGMQFTARKGTYDLLLTGDPAGVRNSGGTR
jgi:hypothetical protein